MRRALFLLPVSIFLACGGPPQTTTKITTLPSATTSVASPPTVDLSPVTMPQSVAVLIHAAHLGASADMVSEWAGQPLPIDQTLGEMIGERLAKFVDVDGSADMTLAVQDRGARREPEVRVAVGLPIKDFEAAKSQLQGEPGLVAIANGAFEIVRAGSHRHEGDSDFRSCAIAPAKTGGRLVCSRDATWRDLVLPYLTRGLGNLATNKSDVHVDARPGPLREIVQRDRANLIQSGARWMGGGTRTLAEAAIADLCDSFLDTDRATIDATLDAKVGAIDLKISAKGSQGLTTRILSGHPERAEPPPAMFLRLPEDADVAFFEHGLDAAQLAGPRTQTVAYFESLAQQSAKLSAADQKAFMDAYSHTLDFAAVPIVYARGVDFSKAIPAVAGLTEQSDAAKIRAGAEQAAGYDIIGIDAAPDKVIALAKELVAAVSRPVIATDKKDTKWRVVAAPRNAPAGSVHLALTHEIEDIDYAQPRSGTKKRPPIVLTLHSLIVPDGTHAWIVSALDEATAVNKARALIAPSPTSGMLATRAGLDGLRAARINAGGFITPRSVGLGIPFSWLDTWNLRYKMGNDPLVGVSSQSQFTTPIVFSATESAENDEKMLTVSLRVTRAVVADALAVAPHIFR